MLLSVDHPELISHFKAVTYGLVPIYHRERQEYILVIKATKEVILTARLNQQFKVYFLSDPIGPHSHLGFTTAFFDDYDEPLTITSAQFADDEMLRDLTALLRQPEFEVYFFDENNREMLGVRARNSSSGSFAQISAEATFPTFADNFVEFIWRLEERFSIRDEDDDRAALTIEFVENLYPDDFIFIDARFPATHVGGENSASTNMLYREQPGEHQERDIALLLSRVFNPNEIYLNPVRTDNGKEICDLMVVRDGVILFVQAKDSPNTETSLRRTIERKRLAIRGHIAKAARQVLGAARYAGKSSSMTMLVGEKMVTVEMDARQAYGLVVVQEMFDDDYKACSETIVEIARVNFPTVLVGYSGLHVLAQNLPTSERFLESVRRLSDAAVDAGEYPKPVWLGPPVLDAEPDPSS